MGATLDLLSLLSLPPPVDLRVDCPKNVSFSRVVDPNSAGFELANGPLRVKLGIIWPPITNTAELKMRNRRWMLCHG